MPTQDRSKFVLSCITRAARRAAGSGHAAAAVERFLKTGNSHLSRSCRYSIERIEKHEAAHLLHYLKLEHCGLTVKRGQERFLDVRFIDRELFAYTCEAYTRLLQKGRGPALKSAEKIWEICGHYPPRKGLLKEIAALLLKAAKARNGWKVIKERTVEKRGRVWRKQQLHDALFAISAPA